MFTKKKILQHDSITTQNYHLTHYNDQIHTSKDKKAGDNHEQYDYFQEKLTSECNAFVSASMLRGS